jgi:carbohydrate-selective porin OprB
VRVRGPLASRPSDEFLVGAILGHLSSGCRAVQAAAGVAAVANGNVVEVSWRAALTRYFAVQPLFQSSSNTGGATDAKQANVFGVRLDLVL